MQAEEGKETAMTEMLVLILILLAAIALVARQIVRIVKDKGGCHHCPGCPSGKTPNSYVTMDRNVTPPCASCEEGVHGGVPEAEEERDG